MAKTGQEQPSRNEDEYFAKQDAELIKQMRAKPVLTPRNLSRMPHHAQAVLDVTPEEAVGRAKKAMRGWRMDAGDDTVSAERGYLRETGNLVFHFALLGLLVSFALGKMYNYEGQVIVQANGGQFCNGGIFNYDQFRPGLRVDGTDLTPFCVEIGKFSAEYLENGQPVEGTFRAHHVPLADVRSNP